jgi:pyrimidine 5'-nucleotidase
MPVNTLFIDLDDTIYPPRDGIWEAIGVRIDSFIHLKLGHDPLEIPLLRERLFHQYGTTLRGLQTEFSINPFEYLDYVHNIPLKDLLTPNPGLKDVFAAIPQRKLIFTNSDRNHSRRVLEFFNILPFFERIIDVMDVAPYCKPNLNAFQSALQLAGVSDPSTCALIDDSPRNIQAAHQVGMYCVHVGPPDKTPPSADRWIANIESLPSALAEMSD